MITAQPILPTQDLRDAKSFIEAQLPVAKLSAESYKERTAKQGQTLTGLGKWWGRKPLILVRATLLGLLLPATSDPQKDAEVYLKLLTMDEDGLWSRRNKALPVLSWLQQQPEATRRRYLIEGEKLNDLAAQDWDELERRAWAAMSYSEKITYCARPEQMSGPSEHAWGVV